MYQMRVFWHVLKGNERVWHEIDEYFVQRYLL